MEADRKSEDLGRAVGELFGDAVGMPRLGRLAVRGRKYKPVVRDADEAKVNLDAVGCTSDYPLIARAF